MIFKGLPVGISNLVTSSLSSSNKNLEAAKNLGSEAAKIALSKGINEVVFDRGGFSFGQNLKALADSAREEGLKF